MTAFGRHSPSGPDRHANNETADIARALSSPRNLEEVTPNQLFDLLEGFHATPSGTWRGDGIALDSVRKLRKALGF